MRLKWSFPSTGMALATRPDEKSMRFVPRFRGRLRNMIELELSKPSKPV